MAEATHPRCLTESRWPGTDPRVCHCQWLRIRGASGSAWLSWPGTNLGTGERAQLGAWGLELGCQRHCGHVAWSQPHLQASEGIPPLPSHDRAPDITQLPRLLQAHGWSKELPAGHISRGILWQAPFPKAPGFFRAGAHPLHQ